MSQALLAEIEGKYEVLGRLRSGGMGVLYRVRHRLLDEERVIKVLHARHVRDPTLRERFVREARAAIRLRHPNVVQVHDFSLDATGAGLIVMESIDGVDLECLADRSTPPSLGLGLDIARQALRALGYLHRQGFVHRDVSPDNLMLSLDVDARPHVQLIDLGIARPKDGEALTLTGSFLGKLRYASPEHLGRDALRPIERRSDLYALGLVLFELWTGCHPFRVGSASELIAAQLRRPPRSWATVDPDARLPEAARTMLERALRKDPDERWSSAEEWSQAVEALQARHPVDDAVREETRSVLVKCRGARTDASGAPRPARRSDAAA